MLSAGGCSWAGRITQGHSAAVALCPLGASLRRQLKATFSFTWGIQKVLIFFFSFPLKAKQNPKVGFLVKSITRITEAIRMQSFSFLLCFFPGKLSKANNSALPLKYKNAGFMQGLPGRWFLFQFSNGKCKSHLYAKCELLVNRPCPAQTLGLGWALRKGALGSHCLRAFILQTFLYLQLPGPVLHPSAGGGSLVQGAGRAGLAAGCCLFRQRGPWMCGLR